MATTKTNMAFPANPLVWLLIDDRTGDENQVRGVAEALGLRYQLQALDYTAAAQLPNFVMGPTFGGLTRQSRVNLNAPWPDLVIAAGRRTAPVARNIKKLSGGKTFLAQVMYPGDAGFDEFDLVAVPRHDNIAKSESVFYTTGAPHRVTPGLLRLEADQWADRVAALPHPRLAVIVGGSSKRRKFDDVWAKTLADDVSKMANEAEGSVMVTTSRRTGDGPAAALTGALTAPNVHHIWKRGDEENPFYGYLGLADAVVVTGESTSMCTEACATEKPVYIWAPKKLTSHKHGQLHKELYDRGFARPFEGVLESWTHPPINPAGEIADEIKRRLGIS